MRSKFTVFIMLSALICTFSIAQENNLKERFLKRKPVLNALKDQEIIGENNEGLITFRKADEENKQIVEEENADRLKVYSIIAKRHGINVAEVGKRRAVKIARIASPGHWLQDVKGKWYKKQ